MTEITGDRPQGAGPGSRKAWYGRTSGEVVLDGDPDPDQCGPFDTWGSFICARETKRIHTFLDEHGKVCPQGYDRIELINNSVGNYVIVHCRCGVSKEVTHMEHW